MNRFILLGALLFSSSFAFAQSLTLNNLSEDDVKKVVGDFSAVFNHTSVSGASTLGTIFGFELGVVGGITHTKELDRIADTSSGTDQKADKIPHGELLGMITVPAGFTVEVGMIPRVGKDEFKFQTFSLAAKWTPTDVFLDLPLSLAIKAHVTKSKAEFNQTISNVATKYDYDSTITGFTLLASKNFVLVEPYVGFGLLTAKGHMDVTGASTVFNFTTDASASATRSTSEFLIGAELKLLVVKLGAEYATLFGESRYTGKLSFYF